MCPPEESAPFDFMEELVNAVADAEDYSCSEYLGIDREKAKQNLKEVLKKMNVRGIV